MLQQQLGLASQSCFSSSFSSFNAPPNIVCLADAPRLTVSSHRDTAALYYNLPYSSVQNMCQYYKDMFREPDSTAGGGNGRGAGKMFEANTMRRGNEFLEQCGSFMDDIEQENLRAYTQAMTSSGRVEITPVQALHLPDPTKPVYVKFTYGDEAQSTGSCAPTAYPVWDTGTSCR
jgi:hypothetical protein